MADERVGTEESAFAAKRLTKELAQQTIEELKSVVAHVVCDLDGTIIAWDDRFCSLFCVNSICSGNSLVLVLQDQIALRTFVEYSLMRPSSYLGKRLVIEKNQRPIDLLVDAMLIREVDQDLGYVFVLRELFDSQQVDARKVTLDKIDVIARMAAGISHEIRNPLTSVMGFLHILEDPIHPVDETQSKVYLELIRYALRQIYDVIDPLFILARAIPWKKMRLSLSEIIRNVLQNRREICIEQRIEVRWEDATPFLIEADETELTLLIDHLFLNAIESMEAGGVITIHTVYDRTLRKVRLDIIDEGSGIPYYMIDRIFDVFYTTKAGHLGLGLSIAQRIVMDLGGELRIAYKGKGTTASVWLMPCLME